MLVPRVRDHVHDTLVEGHEDAARFSRTFKNYRMIRLACQILVDNGVNVVTSESKICRQFDRQILVQLKSHPEARGIKF